NELTGAYQLVKDDPSDDHSNVRTGEEWVEHTSESMTESGNFLSQSMTLDDIKDETISDTISVDAGGGNSGTVILSASVHEIEDASLGSPSASVSMDTTKTYSNASIDVQGTIASDPRWESDNASLVEEFINGIRRAGGFLLFQHAIHSSDGTVLPLAAT